MDLFKSSAMRKGILAIILVVCGHTVALITLTTLVSCGWVDGFGRPQNTPPPPSAGMDQGMGPPGAAVPNFDSQDTGSPGEGSPSPGIYVSLSANMLASGEVVWNAIWPGVISPYRIAWDFGGGATNIPEDAAVSPASVSVFMNGLGPYMVEVTVTDAQGLSGLATRLYTLDPEDVEGVLVDDRIYAYFEKGQAEVGEEILVTVTTGKLSHPFQFMLNAGLVMDQDAEYVAKSFNIGAPGGDKDFPDGIWAEMNPPGYILPPDSLIKAGANPEDSLGTKNRFDFNVSPLSGHNILGASGDLFNLRVEYSEPGLKTLAFEQWNGVSRTYYSGYSEWAGMEERYWDDFSNWHPWLLTSIVVVE